ncbi:MAG: hypothetical protein KGY76_00240 [Candidatus Thermoplasmatota archaeon]|nr:hypothetical protein [Candidatus Thermoplasmatota archaeon]
MSEESINEYLENSSLGSNCENCESQMKLLDFRWGDTESHRGLVTILNTILEEDEMLDEPFQYDKLSLEYCDNCGAINLSIS